MNERIIQLKKDGKEIDCNELLEKLPLLISDRISSKNICTINISGASAAGKSTISKLLENTIPGSKVLNMDSYLKGWSIGQLNHDSGDPNKPYFARLNPDVYDLKKLFNDLLELKQGNVINEPIFDDLTKEPKGTKIFDPPQVLILEGIYSLESPFLEIGDIPVLVEASLHDRLVRKIVRNSVLYNQNVDEIIDTYLTNDEPTYPFYRDQLRNKAQLIVNNPLYPARDFKSYEGKGNNINFGWIRNVTPKNGNGLLHFDEEMRIVQLGNNCSLLQYFVENRLLINAPINLTTIKLIENYYNID